MRRLLASMFLLTEHGGHNNKKGHSLKPSQA